MRNIRLTLAYDGTGYVGWQIQPNGLSVQAAVEEGLRRLTGTKISLLAAGRTDAGVHALGQIANFQTDSRIPCQGFRAGLQTFLPRDILVLEADEVGLRFHATHLAKRKRYRYVIMNARARHPFLRNYAYEVHQPLDAAVMQTAAQRLVGRHDFRAFESEYPNTSTSVRTVLELTVTRQAAWPTWGPVAPQIEETIAGEPKTSADFIWIEIVANGFLYNMVRTIAGTLIRVGEGKWNADDVCRILAGQDRKQAGPTAPAYGLYLVSVDYGDLPVSSVDVSSADECQLSSATGEATP